MDHPPTWIQSSSSGDGSFISRSSEDVRSLVGRPFGPYHVDEEIARGGQGMVLRAVHTPTGRVVALKILTQRGGAGEKRFRQEAQVLGRLDHPSLPKVFETGEHNGMPFIAQQLIEGEHIKGALKTRGPYDPADAVALIGKLAEVLEYCHRWGIVHRDLKPSNVVVESETGRPYLLDFGLVQRDADKFGKLSVDDLSRMSASGELRGTPSFMAPEQSGGAGAIDSRADVYGLAATLYCMLTGEKPFSGAAAYNVIMKVVSQPAPDPCALNPQVPRGLGRVVQWAMEKDPGDRPGSVGVLQEELLLALKGVQQPPAGGRARVLLVGGVLLAGLAGGLGFAFNGKDAPSSPQPGVATKTAQAPPPAATKTPAPAKTRATEHREDPLRGAPEWFRKIPAEARPRIPFPNGIKFGAAPGEDVHPQTGLVLVWVEGTSWSYPSGKPKKNKRRKNKRRKNKRRKNKNKKGKRTHPWTVQLSGYFLGKYEVSWGQYEVFCKETNRHIRRPAYQVTPNHPVHLVKWWGANAYCQWANMSLPTELQWRHAFGGPKGTRYPWGDEEPGPKYANLKGADDGYEYSAPVGSFPKDVAHCGARDMAGNLSEWIHNWRGRVPPPPDGVDLVIDPRGPEQGKWKSWGGGNWKGRSPRGFPSAGTEFAQPETGFRVALSHP